MTYTEKVHPCKTPEFRQKMRAIALARGYKPPSQKGVKRSTWNKGKKMLSLQGDKHYLWKGNDAHYVTIHAWVRRHKGSPTCCEHCGKTKTTKCSIQWANIDHAYQRNLGDYMALCATCHRAYDKRL